MMDHGDDGGVTAGGAAVELSKPMSRSSSIGGSWSIEYTSLRDVLVEGSDHQLGAGGSWCEYSCYDIHDFDASNIGIRNQLLKHAASAYLQSAVVVASCDQGCLGWLWRQVQLRGGRGRVAGVRRRPRRALRRVRRRSHRRHLA